jgi:lysophospholipid acyltransferase (LPLAT)-like uncharacterized protein
MSVAPPESIAAVASPREARGWRRLVLWPLGLMLKLWGRSWRFVIDPADRAAISRQDEPVAMMLWHNRLIFAAEIVRRYRGARPVYALVSASKDGAWLTAFFRLVGIRTVRGSSSLGGREAALALVGVLRAGGDIGLTPDGPRGPCYDFKAGGLIVARRAGVRVLLLGGEFASAWRMGSWDGFYLPKPFSTVRVRCIDVPPEELTGDREAVVARLDAQLRAINPD